MGKGRRGGEENEGMEREREGRERKEGRGDGEGEERKGRRRDEVMRGWSGRKRGGKGRWRRRGEGGVKRQKRRGVHYRKDCLMLFPDNPDKKNILDKNKSFTREMSSRTLTLPCKKRKKNDIKKSYTTGYAHTHTQIHIRQHANTNE